MKKYSKELVNRYIKYMQEKHGIKFSEETAIEYLDSLARLHSLFLSK